MNVRAKTGALHSFEPYHVFASGATLRDDVHNIESVLRAGKENFLIEGYQEGVRKVAPLKDFNY